MRDQSHRQRSYLCKNQPDRGTAFRGRYTIIGAVGLGLNGVPIFEIAPRSLVCIIWGLRIALHDFLSDLSNVKSSERC